MFEWIKSRKGEDKRRHENGKRLKRILTIADRIGEQGGQAALREYTYLLGREFQSRHLAQRIVSTTEHSALEVSPATAWFDPVKALHTNGTRLIDLKKSKADVEVELANTLILPWPWHTQRIVDNLSRIGEGRPCGRWKFDRLNHSIEIWLPFGIGWVFGGNHSIMAGIAQGQGTIHATVYDLGSAFDYVEFDGTSFRRLDNKSCLSNPPDFGFASIFEVGRIANQLDVKAAP